MRISPFVALLVVFNCWANAGAQGISREQNRARALEHHATNTVLYGENPDVLLRPGVKADRRIQRVFIEGEATGIRASSIVEFFLISENSGHDYEAVAVAFAQPSHVHEALEFIGLKPGRAASPASLRFWPKGERVRAWLEDPARTSLETLVPLEHLCIDTRTGEPLPAAGLVFTGSRRIPAGDDRQSFLYAADHYDPHAIASNYNEPASVLDVPRRAPQGEVYQQQLLNPDYVLSTGRYLRVILEPEYPDGKQRVLDVQLEVTAAEQTDGRRLADLRGDLSGRLGSGRGFEPAQLVRHFARLQSDGHDVCVTVVFDGELPLEGIREMCRVLGEIEGDQGIRIEPPAGGQLYYRAFLPDPGYLEREHRIAQPWELFLHAGPHSVTGTVVEIEQVWRDGEIWPDLQYTRHAVNDGRALRRLLDQRGPGLPVILVFCSPALRHTDLLEFLAPVRRTHPTVHVFLDDPHDGRPPSVPRELPVEIPE